MPMKLTNELLTMALIGYSAELSVITAKMAEIKSMLHDPDNINPAPVAKRRGRPPALFTMPNNPPLKKKRKLSAAGRKAIIEATKKRWAAFHKKQRAA